MTRRQGLALAVVGGVLLLWGFLSLINRPEQTAALVVALLGAVLLTVGLTQRARS